MLNLIVLISSGVTLFLYYHTHILCRVSASNLGRIWDCCLAGWLTAGWRVDKAFLGLITCFGTHARLLPRGAYSS